MHSCQTVQGYFCVKKGCGTKLLTSRRRKRFTYFFPHYSVPLLSSEIFLLQKKSQAFGFIPLSYSNTQQSWSASDECPSGAGSKCKFSKEHLSNINAGYVLSGLSDFLLLQKNPHENEILNLFCSCMTVRCTWLVGYRLPPVHRCDLLGY